eukprot:gene8242-5763_t
MVFSTPSYLCVGCRPVRMVDERARGASVIVSRPKTGKNSDALFEPIKYMWLGERGGNPEEVRRKEALESAKKNMTPMGFVYSSPPQKGEGLGSYYGTIGGKIPHNIPWREVSKIPEKREALPRGIYTNRPKQGSYGTPNVGISNDEMVYIANFYDQPRINARKEREEWKKKMPAEPFIPCGRRCYTFDEAPAVGLSTVYKMDRPFKEKKVVEPMAHFTVTELWKPAGYVEDKPTRMEYWEDPYGGYDPRIDPKDRRKKASEKIFYPSFGGDTFWFTQSVVMKRM